MFGKTDFVLHISCIGGIALSVVVVQSLEQAKDDGNVVLMARFQCLAS